MAVVIDAGPLIALGDPRDPRHVSTREFLESSTEALFLSPFVAAEIDHLLAEHAGTQAEFAFIADIARGSFILEPFDAPDVAECLRVMDAYQELDIRLADASIVVLAHRHGTDRVLTFDQRHFRTMRTRDGRPFKVLPADEG